MLTLVLLKLLSDLGLYYAFGGFFAVLAGAEAPVLLWAWGVQSLTGLLAWLLRDRGRLRFLPLALLVVGWLLPGGSVPAWVAMAPPAVYVVWLAAEQRYLPEWGRQVDIFSVFWKVFLIFCLFMLVMGCGEILSAITIPAGLTSLACCVLLNRALRHDLSVCCQPRYQAMNLMMAAGMGLVALVLSSKAFLQGCGAVLWWIYKTVFWPILMAASQLLVGAIYVVMWLFSWIGITVTGEEQEAQDLTLGDTDALLEGLEAAENNSELFSRVCIALALILAAVLLVVVFRWLSRGSRRTEEQPDARTVRFSVRSEGVRPLSPFGRSPVRRVRLHYQTFLKLCRGRGLELERSDTSQDVTSKSVHRFDPAAVRELRQLYIAARYNDQATGEDAARAKELCQALKRGDQ